MPNTSAEFAYLPVFNLTSVCDLNLPLLLDVIVLGGSVATLALVGWLYRRRRKAASAKSTRQSMIGEDGHVERDHLR